MKQPKLFSPCSIWIPPNRAFNARFYYPSPRELKFFIVVRVACAQFIIINYECGARCTLIHDIARTAVSWTGVKTGAVQ